MNDCQLHIPSHTLKGGVYTLLTSSREGEGASSEFNGDVFNILGGYVTMMIRIVTLYEASKL